MTAGQIAQSQRAHARAYQPFHFVTDREQHPSNLAVESLSQNHPQTRRTDRVDEIDPSTLPIEDDSALKLDCQDGIPRLIERDFVLLFDFVTRMREPLGKVAIVGQDEQPLALRVEPSDVKETREFRRQQMEDRVAGVRIAAGGDESARLVKQEIEPRRRASHHPAGHFYMVALARLRAEIRANLPVNRDPARGNQFIAVST